VNTLDLFWGGPQWLEVRRWATEELDAKRGLLEQPQLTHDESNVLRGEIKVLKNLLAQPEMAAQAKVEAAPDWA